MEKDALIKLAAAALLLGFAAFMTLRHLRSQKGDSDLAFFYDLSRKELFKASRTNIPPIKGLDNSLEDAVRAVVVSTNGNPQDRSSWQISYLEMYSPELKAQMEAARAGGTSPAMGRGAASFHRLVKRPGDLDWSPMNSPEGEKIVNEWLTLGPGKTPAAVCVP